MILVLGILLVLTFFWPNFYGQYRALTGITVTDLTPEEIETICENVDISFPESVEFYSAFCNGLQENELRLVFTISAEDEKAFLSDINPKYEYDPHADYSGFTVEIDQNQYSVERTYAHTDRGFTALLEYGEMPDRRYLFQLVYSRPAENIHEIFHERIFLF